MYEKRSYRDLFENKLTWFEVSVGETDLMVGCSADLQKETLREVRRLRKSLDSFIRLHPEFSTSLVPLSYEDANGIIRDMEQAGIKAGTGPMAAVAGAIAMHIANRLREHSTEVFVENGGDLYIYSEEDRLIGIHAGQSVLSGKFAIRVKKCQLPMGVCTSSATVGHSLSFGKADAATVLSRDGALSDALATALCNRIQGKNDLGPALEWVRSIEGVSGAMAVMGDTMGAVGDIELVPWNRKEEES
ncbi:MAG: UPF0280 family protein [Clostridia bacterium]